jgi:tetratricopeptide (TPR) repeat protein
VNKLLAALLLWLTLSTPVPAAPAKQPGAPATRAPAASAKATTAALQLLARGDEHAAAGRYADALDTWRQAYEQLFPAFRGLSFRRPLQVEYLDRGALQQRLREELARELPDEELQATRKAMVAFGFIPPELDLRETYLQLQAEAIAGFYDPTRKRLCLIREGNSAGIQYWWGNSSQFDALEQKTVLIHEMAHALMDQHHDLLALQRAADKNDDRALALSALIEGEATLAMMLGADPRSQSSSFLRLPPGLMDFLFTLTKPLLGFSAGPHFRGAPPILKDTLLFPYLKGPAFCLNLTRQSGQWQPLDAAFSRPPVSTEQILHPEKYPEDTPVNVTLADIQADLPEGWAPVYTNTLGELQIQILLAPALPGIASLRAAEGWAGDTYRVYERSGGTDELPRLLYTWLSTWDTQQEAREFREAMVRVLAHQLRMEPLDITEVPLLPQGMWGKAWLSQESLSAVLGRGSDVWVLHRVPETVAEAVLARVLVVKHTPKGVWRPKPAAKPTPKPASKQSGGAGPR